MELKQITRKDGSKYYRVSGNCGTAQLVAYAQQQLGRKGLFYRITRTNEHMAGVTSVRSIINVFD